GIAFLRTQNLGWTILQRITVDLRTLAAGAVTSFIATTLFGIFPAIQAGSLDIRSAQTGRGILGGARSILRRILPALQVGIAVFLLIGAALLIESFGHLWNLEPGFDATNVAVASFSLHDARYDTPAATNRLFSEVLRRLHTIGGVESAAV